MDTSFNDDPRLRMTGSRPVQVCHGLALSDAARAALADDPSPACFLDALSAAECHEDAVQFLAHAMPRVDAVRWACDCARAAGGDTLPVVASVALAAALRWAAAPSAQRCQDAAEVAEAEGMQDEGAARFVALAAAWSGDSLVAEGLPPTPPPEGLGSAAVAAAVMIAAATGEPAQMGERYRDFIARGMGVARMG